MDWCRRRFQHDDATDILLSLIYLLGIFFFFCRTATKNHHIDVKFILIRFIGTMSLRLPIEYLGP